MKFVFEVTDAVAAQLETARLSRTIESLVDGKAVVNPRFATVADMVSWIVASSLGAFAVPAAVSTIDAQITTLKEQRDEAARGVVALVPGDMGASAA